MKTITIIVFGETAKIIEKQLNLKTVGNITDVNTKIIFEKLPAEGRSKILITFGI